MVSITTRSDRGIAGDQPLDVGERAPLPSLVIAQRRNIARPTEPMATNAANPPKHDPHRLDAVGQRGDAEREAAETHQR